MSAKDTPRIVAVDTMILVWGIREARLPERDQSTPHKQAKWLFQGLDSEQSQVIIPAVALAEYLTPIHEKDHAENVATLSKRFLIQPFDVNCASLAARLFQVGKSVRPMKSPAARKCLRADCLIVATAHVHGATAFYSADGDCRKLAQKLSGWTVQGLPDIAPSLFEADMP